MIDYGPISDNAQELSVKAHNPVVVIETKDALMVVNSGYLKDYLPAKFICGFKNGEKLNFKEN